MILSEYVMPPMGESIIEATLLKWYKKEGDFLLLNEPLLEVSTDKITTEIPVTQEGILHKILVSENSIAQIGKPIALLQIETELPKENIENKKSNKKKSDSKPIIQELFSVETQIKSSRFYSPLIRTIAEKEGISLEELDSISGSGLDNRFTKEDMLLYISRKNQPKTEKIQEHHDSSQSNSLLLETKTEMNPIRKIIAQRMVESKQISPHATAFGEVDMYKIVAWREENKIIFQKKYNQNLTYTPLLLKAVIEAIKKFPIINSSVEGTTIIQKSAINIGMAVALPDGNLVVPVIHKADEYSLKGLIFKVNELTEKARQNKLLAQDLTNGTYTVSNIGTFGNQMGTPIILQPQVAIMAFGVIEKKVVVLSSPTGDTIGIRPKMFISHSFDHRLIDGSVGGLFIKKVSEYLENFDPKETL